MQQIENRIENKSLQVPSTTKCLCPVSVCKDSLCKSYRSGSILFLHNIFVAAFTDTILKVISLGILFNIKETPSERLVTRSYWRSEIPVPDYAQKHVRGLCKPFKHAEREEAWKE